LIDTATGASNRNVREFSRKFERFPAHEISDLANAFGGLTFRIGKPPVGSDARHARNIASHRNDARRTCRNLRIEQLRPSR